VQQCLLSTLSCILLLLLAVLNLVLGICALGSTGWCCCHCS
jgi:hypothetical protein